MNVQMGYRAFEGGQRMMNGSGFGFGGFGLFALVGFVIAGALIVGLVIWAIARKPRAHAALTPGEGVTAPPVADSALAIARDRLARGEIQPEQYAAIAAALSGEPPTGAPQR